MPASPAVDPILKRFRAALDMLYGDRIPRLGRGVRQFPAQAYDMKSIGDYGLGPGTDVPLDRAGAAIDTAEQFVNRVSELSTQQPGGFRERRTLLCAEQE